MPDPFFKAVGVNVVASFVEDALKTFTTEKADSPAVQWMSSPLDLEMSQKNP